MADSTSKKKDERVDGVRYITIPVADNLDDATVEEAIRALAPPVAGIVGNYADIQRAGAAIVAGEAKDMAAGVEVPPGTNETDLKTAAAVEKAVEDARTDRPGGFGPNANPYNTPSPK